MENSATKESYKEIRRRAKEFYKSIGAVWCPALNDYVLFNKSGFRHLIRKNEAPRPRNEQLRRFALLSKAVKILGGTTASMISRKEINACFWALSERGGGATTKVVVRQINGHKKHFFSVF